MTFLSFAKKLGKGAEVMGKDALQITAPALSAAAEAYPPLAPISALVAAISHSVLATSASSATNEQKKSTVLNMVEAISPMLMELLIAKTGRSITDTDRFKTAVDGLIENLLDIYKSVGAVPMASPPKLISILTQASAQLLTGPEAA